MFLWLSYLYADRRVLHEVARSGALSEQSCRIGTRVCVRVTHATPTGTRCEWGVTRNVEQASACRSEVYVTEERVLSVGSLEHIDDFVVFAYRLCEEELTSNSTLES